MTRLVFSFNTAGNPIANLEDLRQEQPVNWRALLFALRHSWDNIPSEKAHDVFNELATAIDEEDPGLEIAGDELLECAINPVIRPYMRRIRECLAAYLMKNKPMNVELVSTFCVLSSGFLPDAIEYIKSIGSSARVALFESFKSLAKDQRVSRRFLASFAVLLLEEGNRDWIASEVLSITMDDPGMLEYLGFHVEEALTKSRSFPWWGLHVAHKLGKLEHFIQQAESLPPSKINEILRASWPDEDQFFDFLRRCLRRLEPEIWAPAFYWGAQYSNFRQTKERRFIRLVVRKLRNQKFAPHAEALLSAYRKLGNHPMPEYYERRIREKLKI